MAAALESKVRTVQRDLDFLRDQLHAPIRYNRLERGYYLTDPDWRLPEVALTEDRSDKQHIKVFHTGILLNRRFEFLSLPTLEVVTYDETQDACAR